MKTLADLAPAPATAVRDDAPRRRGPRMLRIASYAAIALMLIALISLVAAWLYMEPAYSTLDLELTYRINDLAGPNKPVKNVVLRVVKGEGSLTWSGAAGIANEDTQTPLTPETPIYVASVTKLFTATAIMRLYEQGKLSLSDTLDNYLPEDLIAGLDVYQGHDYSHELTISHLLSHTSGLPDYYEDRASDGESLFQLLMADPDRTWTVDEMIARARDGMTPHFAPGTGAYYSDTNYLLLGKVIEAVTGRPLQDVFDEFFFHPLGLTHTWLLGRSEPRIMPSRPVADVFYNEVNITKVRANKAYWADGGIVSTTQDMVSFLKALNTGQIIRRDTLQLMHTWRQLENQPFQYGYGTHYFALPAPANALLGATPVWGHTGSVGSFLYYSEDLDLYMAGGIDQTEDNAAPIMLMLRVMGAVRQLS